MPTIIGSLQHIIVNVLRFLYLFFNTDVFTYFIAILIEKQQRQEPAHSSIPIIKWKNTKEITDECRYDDQRIYGFYRKSSFIA